jgi:hypothetical protein
VRGILLGSLKENMGKVLGKMKLAELMTRDEAFVRTNSVMAGKGHFSRVILI